MTIADEARANSIQCEMVKYAYRQTKDGVVVSFVVHPNDIPAALSTSHIGARYVAVLVQIGDDERPIIQQPAKENKTSLRDSPATPRRLDKPAGAKQEIIFTCHKCEANYSVPKATDECPVCSWKPKRDWRDLQPAAQAGIRCDEPTFVAFLNEVKGYRAIVGTTDAAQAVREICEVHSRSEFSTDHRKRVLWHSLDSEYQAWLAKERVGA